MMPKSPGMSAAGTPTISNNLASWHYALYTTYCYHEAEQEKSFLCASWRLTQLIESERAVTIYIESAKQRHCILHRHLVVIPQCSGLGTTTAAERV